MDYILLITRMMTCRNTGTNGVTRHRLLSFDMYIDWLGLVLMFMNHQDDDRTPVRPTSITLSSSLQTQYPTRRAAEPSYGSVTVLS